MQTEMIGHRLKVSVVLQQFMSVLDTVGADDEVSRFTHGFPKAAKFSVTGRSFNGKFGCQHRHESEALQPTMYSRRQLVIPLSLQDFEKNNVADDRVGKIAHIVERCDLRRGLF